VYGFREYLLGDRRDGYERCRVLQTGGVAVRPEDGDFVIGGSEGFEAFVGLLTVVEGRGHAVETEVGVCDEFWRGPLFSFDAVVGFDVAVDWN